jgi:glycosyltransferase involved in cell wall biosynthesis
MMRVLTIVTDLGPGGTQRAAQNYSLGYQRHGHTVAVLALSSGGPRVSELGAAGIQVFLGGERSEELDASLEAARAWRPDLIHLHRPGAADVRFGYALRRLKERGGPPVLETNVFSRVDFSPEGQLIDIHLHLSEWCLWKWQQWSRSLTPRPSGAVLPYMADGATFTPARPDEVAHFRTNYGIPPDAVVFGRIGQPNRAKWSPVLLTAFAEVARSLPSAYLVLVGLPEALYSHVSRLPDAARSRVVVIPFLAGDEALRQCYSSLDVFVHAAKIGESFGMVLAESMLCGCPVITLSTPAKDNSQLEVVGHHEGGLVVGRYQRLAEAMLLLARNRDLRQSLAVRARKRILDRFSSDQVMPRLLRIAESAASARNRQTLRERLEEDSELVTQADPAAIERLTEYAFGAPTLADKLLMRLVHVPWLYRLWYAAKRKHRRF